MSKLTVVVVAFAFSVALTVANGQDSVFLCVFDFGGEGLRRSVFASVTRGNAFAAGALNTSASDCDLIVKSEDCVKNVPGTKLAGYADVFGKTVAAHCGGHYDDKFWSGFQELQADWQVEAQRDGCEGLVDNVDEACKKLSACTFGTALDAVKGKYSTDVVEFAADYTKFVVGALFEAFITDELPQSCEFVFNP